MLYSLLNTLLLLCLCAFSVPSKANAQEGYSQYKPQNYPQNYPQNQIYTPYNQQQYRQQGYNINNSARTPVKTKLTINLADMVIKIPTISNLAKTINILKKAKSTKEGYLTSVLWAATQCKKYHQPHRCN